MLYECEAKSLTQKDEPIKKERMKKTFAIALIGLFMVSVAEAYAVGTAFQANAFDNDNTEVVFTVGDYDAPVDVIAFEIVPVVTDFTFIAVEAVSYTSVGDFVPAVSIVNLLGVDLVNKQIPIDYGLFMTIETTKQIPIDYGLFMTIETTKQIPNLTEPIYNLTKYVKSYNETNYYASLIVKDITANVGKLTELTY